MPVHQCKQWAGRLNDQGYGTSGKALAHRVIYEREVGPIPPGMTIDHLCHTADITCPGGPTCPHRACVEPTHLEPVPHGTNVRRGRSYSASKTHCPKGHPLDGYGTRRDGGTVRWCKTCKSEKSRAYYPKRRPEVCRKGHPFDRVGPTGKRICSACSAEAGRYGMDVRWHGVTSPRGLSPKGDASR